MSAPLKKICIVCRREFPEFVQECPDDRVRLSEKDTRIGTIFDGKYEIVDFIGAGGLSRVYRARHVELNRIIALKVLRSVNLEDLQRFRREAITFSKLEHPNIARVYAFAVSPDGCPYLAMEYLEGRDLSSYLAREGPLAVSEALLIFEQACAAVEYAHSQSIIHRDIKPSNIVLLSQFEQPGGVKVVDFGMAKFLQESADDDQRITQAGEIFGTRQYISPEQYHGHDCDERSDIYALGVSMYESVLSNGNIPELLQGIIRKATEAEPELRYQTVAEFKNSISTLREALLTGSSDVLKIVAADKKTVDLFGRFYFWTMIAGMICFSMAAGVVIKQRLAVLDKVGPASKNRILLRSVLSNKPLSFAATESQTLTLSQAGRYQDAIALWQNWFEHNQKTADWQDVLLAKKQLAVCYQRTFQAQKAITMLTDAMRTYEEQHAEKSADYADLLNELSVCQYSAGQFDQSIATAEKLLTLKDVEKSTRRTEQEIFAQLDLSRAYTSKRDWSLGEKWARSAEKCTVDNFGCQSSSYAEAQVALADIAKAKRNYQRALEHLDKAIACFDANSCRFEPSLFETYARKAELLILMKNDAGLEKLYLLMTVRLAHSKQPSPASQFLMRKSLARIAKVLGKTDEAKRWAEN